MPSHVVIGEGELVRELLTGEEKILQAILALTNEVLSLRKTVDPITYRQRVVIIAISSFLGGVLTNLAFWLLGFGTMYGILQRGHP